ncbi:MAG: hypothetical protein K2I97_05145 [Alistipes sp.]|nr:hypothetical protein [Alistipes sp.]
MKRYFYLLLLAALVCGCNDSDNEGDNPAGTGSETQRPVTSDEILPRRLVSINEKFDDEDPYTKTFAYDKQGRLASITSGYDYGSEYYTTHYTYKDNTIVTDDGYVYRLQNGRAVTVLFEDEYEQWEDTFNYDAAGYLVSYLFSDNDSCSVTYASNGFSLKSQDDESDFTLSVEFDRTRLNNLNIDFYGICWIEEELTGTYPDALLLGVGGQRWRYLPATMTTVNHFEEEDGKWYTDKDVYRYVYHTEGDYLSEIEIYVKSNNNPEKEYLRFVFHYE